MKFATIAEFSSGGCIGKFHQNDNMQWVVHKRLWKYLAKKIISTQKNSNMRLLTQCYVTIFFCKIPYNFYVETCIVDTLIEIIFLHCSIIIHLHKANTTATDSRWLKGYIYSSCYYHHQIGSIHLSHFYHIFPLLCAWDVCYIIFCHLLHIRSGKAGNLFSLSLCSSWWVQIVGYILACRSYSLFVQYTISLSSLFKLIWRHWTYKMPVRYILSSVWVRFSIFSQLSIIQYVGLCVFSSPISLVLIERIYILCLYYPLFRASSWNNGVHCMSFYIFIRNRITHV